MVTIQRHGKVTEACLKLSVGEISTYSALVDFSGTFDTRRDDIDLIFTEMEG